MDMDKYVRSQAIMSGLMLSLKNLEAQHEELSLQISMVEKVIERHKAYIEMLEKEMED